MRVLLSLAVAVATPLVSALPAKSEVGAALERRDDVPPDVLQRANDQYPAIYWQEAADTCGLERFNILVEATRMAAELGRYTVAGMLEEGWAPFFQQDSNWEGGYIGLYWNMRQMMRGLDQWIFKKPSKDKKQYKVTYRCGNPTEVSEYTNCNKLGVAAYTILPDLDSGRTKFPNCPYCVHVAFCNWFFIGPGAQYLNAVTAGPQKQPNELKSLVTYEHAILHEWVHVAASRWARMDRIRDVEDVVYDGQNATKVYGARLCEDYAWKIPGSLNFQTAYNADNYAWYYTYDWFKKAWSWPKWDRGVTVFDQDDPADLPQADGSDFFEQPADPTKVEAPPDCSSEDGCSLPPDGTYYSKGWCLLNEPCRAGLDDGSFDPDCTCTCDGNSTPVTDERCISPIGPSPPVDVPNPTPTPSSGVHTCASSSDCSTGCCDAQSKICSTPENSTCM